MLKPVRLLHYADHIVELSVVETPMELLVADEVQARHPVEAHTYKMALPIHSNNCPFIMAHLVVDVVALHLAVNPMACTTKTRIAGMLDLPLVDVVEPTVAVSR